MPIIRKQIILKGILQGIGFRPTVYRLAVKHRLSGWVVNTTGAVRIEVEGNQDRCQKFVDELPSSVPFPGRIDEYRIFEKSVTGATSFMIQQSLETQRDITPIPPDVATCPSCASELFDPQDRRFLFPFITCTLCGPRFTVVRSFPYDRDRTSMADFVMCDECRKEYENPLDRRFHSQTNSCPVCGPRMRLVDRAGNEIDDDPVMGVIKFLKQGKIAAIKGIGGFHLAVDAYNSNAVQRLRDLKNRPEKPFAIMTRDLQEARKLCEIDAAEEQALTSAMAPIVLLRSNGAKVAPEVAPFVGSLGVMLPYSPTHHLLFRRPSFEGSDCLSALVMTSGNHSDEPIAVENGDALQRLGSIADVFLIHNRQIVLRADDSIVRVIRGKPSVFRRSRGYVPMSFRFQKSTSFSDGDRVEIPGILGVGADLKNAPAIVSRGLITPGPHVGDLESPEAQDHFTRSIDILTNYLEVTPSVIAFDPHPGYFSSRLAQQHDKQLIPVYHHHAHAVSLLVENGLDGPALFVVFDGTGYGEDGTIWGGEFLLADRSSFQRVARLGLFPLIGAEMAIREPLRIAAGLLALSNGGTIPAGALKLFGAASAKTRLWLEAWEKGINTPLTSSAGRLFDAAAALTGFRRPVTFEGQAAMWLESIADANDNYSYKIEFNETELLEPDVASLTRCLAEESLADVSPARLAARFHNSVVELIAETVRRLEHLIPDRKVGLTGGCFQNKRLVQTAAERLEKDGFDVLLHSNVPVNDGGIAIGQAMAGMEIWLRENRTKFGQSGNLREN
ncbi:MAG: carbamoyltransferase HypF [Desulfomonilaceae bacterium]